MGCSGAALDTGSVVYFIGLGLAAHGTGMCWTLYVWDRHGLGCEWVRLRMGRLETGLEWALLVMCSSFHGLCWAFTGLVMGWALS
jgi:hypothetical protein